MLAESIFAKLSAEGSATAAILGTGDASKVYPVIAPDGTQGDYVAWQTIPDTPHNTFGETRGSGTVLAQFSCVASTYRAAVALGNAVMTDLDNQTLAAGEVCTSVSAGDGYSQSTDQFLRIVEASFFVPAVAPA